MFVMIESTNRSHRVMMAQSLWVILMMPLHIVPHMVPHGRRPRMRIQNFPGVKGVHVHEMSSGIVFVLEAFHFRKLHQTSLQIGQRTLNWKRKIA